jgi:hypothetical protein
VARDRERVVAACALAYVLGFILILVPLARLLGTYFAYRRVESLVPPALMLVAITIVGIADRLELFGVKRWTRHSIAAGVVAGIVVLSFVAIVSYYGTEKTNYRAFAQAVRDAPSDQSIVVVPGSKRSAGAIQEYLGWQHVDRPVIYLLPRGTPDIPLTPGGVRWLTGSAPGRRDMKTRALNDLGSMQVIAGGGRGAAILPWFESTSRPRSSQELAAERDAVAVLPPIIPAPS